MKISKQKREYFSEGRESTDKAEIMTSESLGRSTTYGHYRKAPTEVTDEGREPSHNKSILFRYDQCTKVLPT